MLGIVRGACMTPRGRRLKGIIERLLPGNLAGRLGSTGVRRFPLLSGRKQSADLTRALPARRHGLRTDPAVVG
jgi:hypothetical protein